MLEDSALGLDSGRVGCHTCGEEALVPAATADAVLWDFFAAHGPPCRTWVDVPAFRVPTPRPPLF